MGIRLPFLQVSQESLARARTLARLLRIPEAHGVGLVVSLTAWALEMASEEDLSGRISDPAPAVLIAAAVGWDGDPEALLDAMRRTGVVMLGASGEHSVMGLDVYFRALTGANIRSEKASKAASARWGRKNDAQSNAHALPKQTSPDAQRCLDVDVYVDGDQVLPTEVAGTARAPPRQEALVAVAPSAPRTTAAQEFVAWFRDHTRPLLAPDAPENWRLKDGQWARLGKATKAQGLDRLRAAAQLFCADSYAKREGLPLGLFVAQWEQWAGRVAAPASAAPAGPVRHVRAETQQHGETGRDGQF